MHVSYDIHTLVTWLGHEEGLIQIQTYSMEIRCNFKSKQQKSFISFNTVTTSLFLQPPPCSSFVPTMSLLPIILIINLSAKSYQRLTE